jgi:uncharacterized protein
MRNEDNPLRVVFDTGVILQAILSRRGPSANALMCLNRSDVLAFTSPQVLEEYEDVLARSDIRERFPTVTDEVVRSVLEWINAHALSVVPLRRYVKYPRDPDDEQVISLAIHVRADLLVTRDRDLLDLTRVRDFRLLYPFLRIVSPNELLRRLKDAGNPAT